MSGFSAGVLEVLQLPFAPFKEFVLAFSGFQTLGSDHAEGEHFSGDAEKDVLIRYGMQRERLYAKRELAMDHVQRDGNSPQAVREFRQLASQFRELGRVFVAEAQGLGDLPLEIAANVREDTEEMEALARELEADLAREGARSSEKSGGVLDPRLLTALDRLGFSQEDLQGLTAKAVSDRFRERATQFHPDTKSEKDKDFYEDQMKRLNEAKDRLTAHLEK